MVTGDLNGILRALRPSLLPPGHARTRSNLLLCLSRCLAHISVFFHFSLLDA